MSRNKLILFSFGLALLFSTRFSLAQLPPGATCLQELQYGISIDQALCPTCDYAIVTVASTDNEGTIVDNLGISDLNRPDIPDGGACLQAEGPGGPGSLPTGNSTQSSSLCASSTININSNALGETIPLVGVNFSLSYSSDRFRAGVPYDPRVYGLGGWTPSLLHKYDPVGQILYLGNGATYPVAAATLGTGLYVTNQDGSEIYLLDSSGNLLTTEDGLTGALKYSFSYDSQGRISVIADTFGNQTQFSYSGSQVTMTSPYGQVSQMNYDGNGYLASVTNPNSETYSLTNSSSGLLLNFGKPMGQTSTVTYDSNGFLLKDLGAGGNFISLLRTFNAQTNMQTVVASTAMGIQTIYETTNSSNGSIVGSVTYPSGGTSGTTDSQPSDSNSNYALGISNVSQFQPDPRFGWMAPYASQLTYSSAGTNINFQESTTKSETVGANPLTLVSSTTTSTLQGNSARTFSSVYLASNQSLTNTSPLGRVTVEKFNANAQMSSLRAGPLTPYQFSYDAKGKLKSAIQDTHFMTFTYDAHGNLASETNALGQVSSFKYDAANRMTSETLPDGSVVKMAYDHNGDLTSLTPPSKPAHLFTYNLMGLVSSYLPPALNAELSGNTVYQYNLDQQVSEVDRPDGSAIQYLYGPTTGLLGSITIPTGSYIYSYIPSSNLLSSVQSPDNVQTFYSYAGRTPLSMTMFGPVSGSGSSSVNYAYNPDGTLASLGIQDLTIALSYDNDGLVIGSGDETFTRNNFSAISGSKLNKMAESIGYDSFGQIVTDAFTQSQVAFFEQDYVRDNLGRITQTTQSGQSTHQISYQYDAQGRLSLVNEDGIPHMYTYDANGNRTQLQAGTVITNATYDNQDRLLTYGNLQYQYDANGNRISKTRVTKSDSEDVTQYTYDAFNNLKTVTLPNGNIVQFLYDGLNRRVGKMVNGVLTKQYLYQNQTQIAAVLDGTGLKLKAFVYGEKGNSPDYVIIGSKEYRIVSDQVGTPLFVVDPKTGAVMETMGFDEFGNSPILEGDSIIPFGFAGGLFDRDTRLVHFGARDYDPETGRFLTKDPLLFGGGSTNIYSYVVNDPINRIDPTGKVCIYSQGSGQLTCWDPQGIPYVNTTNFSGNGEGLNNPDAQNIPFEGPIPQGTYTFGAPNNGLGPLTLPIIPDPFTNTFGRSGFYLHGGTMSEGCIINNSPGQRGSIPNGEPLDVVP